METMRDIERRIDSVENTKKITRAMKMVASAKLKTAQDMAEEARPFFNKTQTILRDIVKYTRDESEHPLLTPREGNKQLLVVIGADRGLCGPYNNRIMDIVQEEYKNNDSSTHLFLIGKRIKNYFARRDYNIVSEYVDIDDYPDFEFARKMGQEIISLFSEKIVDRVSVIYTHFNSALSQTVKVESLIPVSSPQLNFSENEETDENTEEKTEENKVDYIYEPSTGKILDMLLPKFVNNMVYSMLLESKASEFGARMTAMDSATENAEEMIEELTLSYNRARQAAITKEITEIVGGAEALEK